MGLAQKLAVALVATTAFAAGAAQAQIQPQPFPPSFRFPQDRATIDRWVTSNNQVAMRLRSWNLWQAMATPSGQIYNGANLPIWETWYGTEELFPPNATCTRGAAAADRQPSRAFIDPNQFSHHAGGTRRTGQAAPGPTPSDFQVVSFNKFNGPFGAFVMSPQQGPAGPGNPYCYRSGASLTALGAAFATANTPGAMRKINEFPAAAIATKPVFGVVKATGVTVLPMWQGPGDSINAINPTPGTWKTCVLVDPSKPMASGIPAAGDIPSTPNLACQRYRWASLSQLYHFQMSASEAAAYNTGSQATQGPGPGISGITAAAGDYAALFAMHVTTKETQRWTWQTFYWQPIGDTPQGFPGSKAHQPSTLPAPWNSYAMCTAYAQTTPFGSPRMTVCFNPYLETASGIPAGITSNCMSCHGVAQAGPNGNYPTKSTGNNRPYATPISFFTDPIYFTPSATNRFVITDFSWATANAQ